MKRPLFWVSVSTIAGAAMGQLLTNLFGIFSAVALGLCVWGWNSRHNTKGISNACILAVLAGMILSFYYGIVANEYFLDICKTDRYTGTITKVNEGGYDMRIAGHGWFSFFCTVYDSDYAGTPGQSVLVHGTPNMHQPARNDGQFEAKAYYDSIGNLFSIEAENTMLLEEAPKWKQWLTGVRNSVEQKIVGLYSEVSEGFLSAIFLGDRRALPDSLYEAYQKFGIAHILAISGMHIALLGGILLAVFGIRLPKPKAGVCSAMVLLLYGGMTGFSVSCIRAIGTFAILYCGRLLKRTSDPITSIAFLAMLLVIKRPTILTNVGFQMSFASGAFMILFGRLRVMGTPKEAKWKRVLRSSLLMQMGLLPLQVFYFYQFSIYGVLVNLMVLLGLEFVFVLFLISVILSYVYLPFAVFVSGIIEWSIRGLNALCAGLEKLPGAVIVTGCPSIWQVVMYCLAFVWILLQVRKGYNNRLILMLALWLILIPFRNAQPVLYNLDVGQGDCSVILCGDTCIVIDCGSTSKNNVGSGCLQSFLKYHGYSEIDSVFLSHTDEDHTGGVTELAEAGYFIGNVFLPMSAEEDDLAVHLSELGYQVFCVAAGDTVEIPYGGVFGVDKKHLIMEVLWPKAEGYTEDSNRESMVLYVQFEKNYGLFTGDIDAEVMEYLVENESTRLSKVSYLKVPHHGSAGSLYEAFYRQTKPVCAVVSVGVNSYGHPKEEVLDCLNEYCMAYFCTKETGQVQIRFEKQGIRIRTKQKQFVK